MPSRSIPEIALPGVDINSLITTDLSQPEYRSDQSTNSRYINRAVDSFGNRAVLLNANGDAGGPGNSFFQTAFAVPQGVTSATLIFIAAAATPSNTTVKLALYDAGMSSILISQRFTLEPGGPQTLSLRFPNLTPGATYGVAPVVNDAGQQARIFSWSFAVKPDPAPSGIFSGDFIRIRNSSHLMGRTSVAPAWFQNWAPMHSRLADIDLVTDATRIAAGCYMGESITFPQDPVRLGYMVGGRPRTFSAEYPTGLSINETALPLLPGDTTSRSITIRTRASGLVGQGTWLRELYLPLGSSVRLNPRTSSRTMVVMADSLATAFPGDNQWTCWVMALRERYPGAVLFAGAPGQQLHDFASDIEGAADVIVAQDPTDVWIALSTNDYFFALWSASDFGAAYARYVDRIRARCRARIFCQSAIHRVSPASEGSNGPTFNNTLADFRAQILAVATDPSRTKDCRFVDGYGSGFPQVPGFSDGIHMLDNQHGQYAQLGVFPPLVAAGVL